MQIYLFLSVATVNEVVINLEKLVSEQLILSKKEFQINISTVGP